MALRAFADGALFAESMGEGPPRVLALHGWGRRGSDFRQALAGIEAIALDLPGFGASPPPAEAIGAEGYSKLIEPLLDEFADPPVVVGHSFGGRVAVCLASAHPDRVGNLVITGAPLVRAHPTRKPSPAFRVVRALNRAHLVSDRRMEELRRSRGSADYRAATGVMREILVRVVNEAYEEELDRLRSRVFLLWGSNDEEVPVSVAEAALRRIREAGGNAELEVLDGVGHFLPVEAPLDLRRLVVEALAG